MTKLILFQLNHAKVFCALFSKVSCIIWFTSLNGEILFTTLYQIIPCLSYCPAGIMVIGMWSTKVKQFLFKKKEPNLSFVAAKIQKNCTGTGNYNFKATRQGIISGHFICISSIEILNEEKMRQSSVTLEYRAEAEPNQTEKSLAWYET